MSTIVGQGVGRSAPSTALTSQVLPWVGTSAFGQRIGVQVFAVTDLYYKLVAAGASAPTVSSTDCHGKVALGTSALLNVGKGIEPVFTGTVQAVEVMGSYE